MAFQIEVKNRRMVLRLEQAVTAQDAAPLARQLREKWRKGTGVLVLASKLEDVDASIVQLLISLQKTAAWFQMDAPSGALRRTADRCALRRELFRPLKAA